MKLTSCVCFETKTLGQAFVVVNELLERLPLEVLDCSPMAVGRTFVLLAGEEASVKQAFSDLNGKVLDLFEIPKVRQNLLDGLFSLLSQPVLESLLIVEMASLPYLLKQTQVICEQDDSIKVIEIRPYRATQAHAIAILTAQSSVLEPIARTLTKELGEGINFLKSCSPRFLEFYDLPKT